MIAAAFPQSRAPDVRNHPRSSTTSPVPIGPDHDAPVERTQGLNARRERRWGVIGGTVGSVFGVGAFLVSKFVDDARGADLVGSPYPPFLERPVMLAFDWFLLTGLAVGLGFLIYAVVLIHVGRYPRTDGYGATLLGAILTALSGTILFIRLWAVLHATVNPVF